MANLIPIEYHRIKHLEDIKPRIYIVTVFYQTAQGN